MPSTSARSWLISSSAAPARRRSASTASTWACTVASSAVVGSSAINKDGAAAIAEAISARWRRPPDNSCACSRARRSGSGMPTARIASSTRASRSPRRRGPPCRASDSAISSPMVRSGSSETSASCITRPAKAPRTRRQSRSRQPSASRPSISKRVAEMRAPAPARPSRLRAVRLLPEPDSPTSATHSPGRMLRSTPRTSGAPPAARSKPIERSRTSTSTRGKPSRDVFMPSSALIETSLAAAATGSCPAR